MADASFTAGRHEALIETLGTDVAQMKSDIAEIKAMLAEKRGERRVALYFAAGGGGIAATFLTFAAKKFLGVP